MVWLAYGARPMYPTKNMVNGAEGRFTRPSVQLIGWADLLDGSLASTLRQNVEFVVLRESGLLHFGFR